MQNLVVRTSTALAIFTLMASTAAADGIIARLPDDGAWARFDIAGKGVGGPVELTGSLTVSSVGRETSNGEPCRWIELEMVAKMKRGNEELKDTDSFKLLIAEKGLVKGQNPRDHIVKAFKKNETGNVRELDLKGDGAREVQSLDEILHGPLTNVAPLEAKTIDVGEKPFKCTGESGDDGDAFKTETRFSDDAPFGVVSLEFQKRRGVVTLKLVEFGADAKTKIPEAK